MPRDKIWRIDLPDDHESCHPVALRMTLNPQYGLIILRMTPKILSSCHPVGQPDSTTRSYLVTLRSGNQLKPEIGVAAICQPIHHIQVPLWSHSPPTLGCSKLQLSVRLRINHFNFIL